MIATSSPAIHLHAVLPGGLVLLPRLIGEVIVPFDVGQELAAGIGRDLPSSGDFARLL